MALPDLPSQQRLRALADLLQATTTAAKSLALDLRRRAFVRRCDALIQFAAAAKARLQAAAPDDPAA